ncbi:MAG: hypothetical protein ACRDAX_01995 [Propionibacteriaceae bacterium]
MSLLDDMRAEVINLESRSGRRAVSKLLQSRLRLANTLRDAEQHKEAVHHFVLVHQEYVRREGEFSRCAIETSFLVGDSLRLIGEHEKGCSWLEAATRNGIQHLGANHSITVLARNSWAITLEVIGRNSEAIALFRENVAVAEPNYLMLNFRANLADSLLRQKESIDEAISLFRLNISVAYQLGKDVSPYELALAEALTKVNRDAEAYELFAQIGNRYEARYGPTGDETLFARMDQGRSLLKQRKYDQAWSYFAEQTLVCTQVLGPSHRWSLRMANQQAIAGEESGQDGIAEFWTQILSHAEASLGYDDAATRHFRRNLIDHLQNRGEIADAIKLQQCEAEIDLAAGEITSAQQLVHILQNKEPDGKQLLAWLESMAAMPSLTPSARQWVTSRIGASYWDLKQYDKATEIWQNSYDILYQDPTADLSVRSRSLLILIDAYCEREQYQRAEDLFINYHHDISAISQSDTACEDLLRTRALIAHRMGEVSRAEELLSQRSHRIVTRLGHSNLQAIRSAAEHAVAVAYCGHHDQAFDIIRQLQRFADEWKNPHPIGVILTRALSEISAIAGDSKAAYDAALVTLNHTRELYGDEARETQSALIAYAQSAADIGNSDDMVQACRRYLERNTVDRGALLARKLLRRAGETVPVANDQRISLSRDPARLTVATWLRDEGAEDAMTLQLRWDLVEMLRERGRSREAIAELETLHDMHKKAGRQELALIAANRQAMTLEELLDPQAEKLFRENLLSAQSTVGDDEPLTRMLRYNLADTLERRGDADSAAWYFGQNILVSGSDPTVEIDARRRLAWTLVTSQRIQQGLLVARRALTDAQAQLTPGAEAILDIRNTVALSLKQLGDAEGAQHLYEENLIEAETALGRDSQVVLPYRNNLARCYFDAGRIDEAMSLYRISAQVATPEIEKGNISYIAVLQHLGESLLSQGDANEAGEIFNKYKNAVVAAYGLDHPRSHEARSLWARAIRSAGEDPVKLADRLAQGSESEAYDAASLLHWCGENDAEISLRLQRALSDPLDLDESDQAVLHREVFDLLTEAEKAAQNDDTMLAVTMLHAACEEAQGLPVADFGRSQAMIKISGIVEKIHDQKAAQIYLVEELSQIEQEQRWGGLATHILVSELCRLLRQFGDFGTHDELIAKNARLLEESFGTKDLRVVQARLDVVEVLRRRKEYDAANRLVTAVLEVISEESVPVLYKSVLLARARIEESIRCQQQK